MSFINRIAPALVLLGLAGPVPGQSEDPSIILQRLHALRDAETLRRDIASLRLARAIDEAAFQKLTDPPPPPVFPDATVRSAPDPDPAPARPPAPVVMPFLLRTYGSFAVIQWGPRQYTAQVGDRIGQGWVLRSFSPSAAELVSANGQLFAVAGSPPQ